MKTSKLIIAATAVLLSSTALSYAIDVKAGAGAAVSASTDATGVNAGADANADASIVAATDTDASATGSTTASASSVTNLTAALAASANADLSSVKDEGQVKLFLVSNLQGSAGAATDEELTAALSAHAAGNDLSAKVDANASVKAALEAAGYSSKNVVALSSEADGSVEVFVDDRAS